MKENHLNFSVILMLNCQPFFTIGIFCPGGRHSLSWGWRVANDDCLVDTFLLPECSLLGAAGTATLGILRVANGNCWDSRSFVLLQKLEGYVFFEALVWIELVLSGEFWPWCNEGDDVLVFNRFRLHFLIFLNVEITDYKRFLNGTRKMAFNLEQRPTFPDLPHLSFKGSG